MLRGIASGGQGEIQQKKLLQEIESTADCVLVALGKQTHIAGNK